MQMETVIPIFPLGLVLLPQMSLPLHIFEDRYKQMTKACLTQDKAFGIVYFDGKAFQSKGCTARIVKIMKRYDDGRLDIITRGENRFNIKQLFDEKPYLEASVEFFDDQPQVGSDSEKIQNSARTCMEMLKQINAITGQYSDAEFDKGLDAKSVSFLAAGCEGFSYQEKQRFLEMTITANRLQKTSEALEKLIQRLRLTHEIERIISGNGNLPKSMKYGADQEHS